jgi:hypothetical protein
MIKEHKRRHKTDDAFSRIEVGGRFGTVDGDANLNGLKAPLSLAMRHFRRVVYTYKRPFRPALEVRRRFLENRRVRKW